MAEVAASQFAQAALNAPRPGSSSYSIFMVAAFAALIYELDGVSHAAQAFDFGDDIVTSSTASDANGLTSALPGFANSGGTAVYDRAFEFAQGDTIATDGSELYVGNAHGEDSGSAREIPIPRGSGTVDVVAAAASEASQSDPTQTGRDNGSNQGTDLRASDNSSEAAKREAPGDDLNHGQSQKALHESDNASGAAKGHAKHEAPGEDSNREQAYGDLQTFEDGSAAGKQHAQHPQASDLDTGKPQQNIPTALVNSANDAHSALKIKTEGRGGPSSENADQAKSAVGTELGDSFRFKSGADNTSSEMYDLQQLSHGNRKAYGDGQHSVAREGPELVQDADGIVIADAHHDHSWHANLHAAHDLIV
ncbi:MULTISPECIES: hypothetical protein [unclassified Bradyrhizobium]|uniref:hypothetical protein n=1 Tax=unclassified Bradyrhizobium TaxID=2631580 RepID=UPI0015CD2304|nr:MULTISPECIES: hypothetical protein [unclassified Bradyrhizobium]MBB4256040.1 hypothetical protein [Bradyrhizobium sp. CIR3A]NYG48208.1 hypothetical protein [Bradyrhizobium sp. IAR9]